MSTTYTLLQRSLSAHLSERQIAWLDEALGRLALQNDLENQLLRFSAMAVRQLGNANLGAATVTLATRGGPMTIAHWSLAEAGRVLLMLKAAADHPVLERRLIEQIYTHGDESEAGAATRGLILFQSAEAFKSRALEVGRTNSKTLYSCLIQDNPYPAMYYSDHEFNQLVLKALFLGLPIAPVYGLQTRSNAELSRMCEDYIDERLAAGRGIPVDIWLALAPHASHHGMDLLNLYLTGEDSQHRHYARLAFEARRH